MDVAKHMEQWFDAGLNVCEQIDAARACAAAAQIAVTDRRAVGHHNVSAGRDFRPLLICEQVQNKEDEKWDEA
jgi:hypothetical protein